MFERFGLDKEENPLPLNSLLQDLKMGVDSFQAHFALLEEYDSMMGIFNHATRDGPDGKDMRPLAAVVMHPKEQYALNGPMAQRAARFMLYGLADRFGISWNDFKKNTRFENDVLFNLADQFNKKAVANLPPIPPPTKQG